MPQVGFHCPRGDMAHADCRVCATNPAHPCEFTPDLLEGMRRAGRGGEPVFSPTRILGCARAEVLKRATPYYEDLYDMYPMTRGTLIHAAMEDARYPGALGVLRERQFWTTVATSAGPVPFEAKVDLIVLKGLVGNVLSCAVVDYKSKGEIGHEMTAALPAHVAQVNIYRWVVTRELPALLGWDCVVDVDEVGIMYIGMNKPRRFTSAGPLTTRGKMVKRRPPEYAPLELEALPLWDLDAVERAVVRRVETRLALAEGELPDVLPEEEQWMCPRCPVNGVCWAKYREEHS